MLLLLAIALVLIGVVTLVIGIISNTLAWVFISIGATVAAGIVLYILYRLGRKQAATAAAAPAAEAAPSAPPAPVVPAPTAIPPAAEPRPGDDRFAPAGTSSTGAATTTRDLAAPTENLRSPGAPADESDGDFDDEDDFFPIAEYEELRVAEILPLLPELDAEELDVVREREASTKARATILNRIDELAPNALGGWSDGDRGEDATTDVASSARPAPAAGPTRRPAAAGSPIAGYDDLKVAEILPRLTQLGTSDLEAVAEQERRGPNRQTILNRIEGRLRFLEGQDAPAPATSAPRRGRGPATPTPTALPTTGRRATSAAKARAGSRTAAPTKAAPTRKRSANASATSAPAAAVPAKRGRPRKDPGSGLPVPASLAPSPTRAPRATSATKATRATKGTAKKTSAAKTGAAPAAIPEVRLPLAGPPAPGSGSG